MESVAPEQSTGLSFDLGVTRPIRGELLGLERLEGHARELATTLSRTRVEAGRPVLGAFEENAVFLRTAHREIAEAHRAQEPLGHDAEWLVDNYHIISDTLSEIRTDLPTGFYQLLPKLIDGPLAGYPRVYVMAIELVAHCDSELDEGNISHFVKGVQAIFPLNLGELWALPIMLRLCLIDNLRRLAESILQFRHHRQLAQEWVAEHPSTLNGRPVKDKDLFALESIRGDWRDCYVVHLLECMHDVHHAAAEKLEQCLAAANRTAAEVLANEKEREAANQVSIGNCVTSLRLLSALDWRKFVERHSVVEAGLRQDPAGVYARQDFVTRDRYRRIVERLARNSNQSEPEVVRILLELAHGNAEKHVGYYLIDAGSSELERALHYRAAWHELPQRLILAHPCLAYFGVQGLILTALLAAGVWIVQAAGASAWWSVLALAVLLIPLSELAGALRNFVVAQIVPPRTLARMDYSEGVPAECATFVVIPSMLLNPGSAAALVERLEIHYLSNAERHLYFGLLTDFADAPAETMPEDVGYLRSAIDGVDGLNKKYNPAGPPRFFLFHRRRQWNAAQNCWMGWERKRGKLLEFNRLLHGDKKTSFSTVTPAPEALPTTPYVITLDTDTQLPRETARRLIAMMAHPLNQPKFDAGRRRVVRGYGVLQPRIGLSLRGARRSLFARIFTGSAGIDPYTTAFSDIYQDLFGSGTFTGKGIFHRDAFAAAVDYAFPENHILSHDLIEGNYARCGLVTDVELLDDFPSHYLAFVRRDHRWVRGDWQILPWLFARVPCADGRRIANPLPGLARWKIFDNLRRSLTPPTLLVLLMLGWTIIPGSPWLWTSAALTVLAWPLLIQAGASPIATVRHLWHREHAAIRSLGYTAAQVGLSAAFLPEHTRAMLDAIIRTLVRMVFTHRHLLEWESAAVTERRLDNTMSCFVWAMWPNSVLAAIVAGVVTVVRTEALAPAAPFWIGWFLSPWIAYRVSQPSRPEPAALTPRLRKDLQRVARKTWSFFETFVVAGDHWLPPDNFQEDPKGEIAHRTSPTNIGLYLLSCIAAHDFGYLSLPELLNRLDQTFSTLRALERSHGHFYNWYETQNLQPLHPIYLSTVDSGNLAACLLVVKQGLLEKMHAPLISPAIGEGFRVLIALIDETFHSLHARSHTKHLEFWRRLEPRLRSLESQVARMPAAFDGYADWLTRLADEHGNLAALIQEIAASIDEPLTEPERWSAAFGALIKQRQDEARALAQSAIPSSEMQERCRQLATQAEQWFAAIDFKLVYNSQRHLFAVGYNLSAGRLDPAHYDLLASEASLTSFLAIARGDVPRKHWFQLARPMIRQQGDVALLSWGGTMFEYLMPRLLLHTEPETLLEESQRAAVEAQIDYGRRCGTPWGISESAFSALDGQLTYQYQAFGAPALGLKRGLSNDLVIAPYATGLAFMTAPRRALENLHRLQKEGADGPYGCYEAIDYTAERMPKGRRSVVVKCFMAHHQGMTMLALANCLLNNPMPRRFHAEPMVRATELLLQERIPSDAPLAELQPPEETTQVTFHEVPPHMSRRITTPHTVHPRAHFLASAHTSMMVTSAGGGQTSSRGLAVTRWREDRTRDADGAFCYVRDLQSGKSWSAAHQPLCREPDEYEVTFATDKVEFRRLDGDIETRMEITISPENHAEVRRIAFTNHGSKPRHLELTSYLEPVLLKQAADLAHPAFGKLFLETEYVATHDALLCRRRQREPEEKPIWALHVMATEGQRVGPLQWETERARFLGRGRTPANPAALDSDNHALSGTVGPVLDPIFSLRRPFPVNAGATVHFALTTALADSRDEAIALADYYHDFHGVQRAFELAWAHSQVELRQLHLSAAESHLFQRLATHVRFGGAGLRAAPGAVAGNRLGQSDLWRLGISGDFPIILVRIIAAQELALARQVITAHSYWRLKGFSADLVLLNDHEAGYFEDLQQQLQVLVHASEDRTLVDKPGGVFLRKASHLAPEDQRLLLAAARCILIGARGTLAAQLARLERAAAPGKAPPELRAAARTEPLAAPTSDERIFANGLGGFNAQNEYVIRVPFSHRTGTNTLRTPQPWVNVIANPAFGFVISESGGGFTWAGNSQMHRLTPWSNDPVSDPVAEVIYLRDERSHEVFSLTPSPRGIGADYRVRHGQGYTSFEHERDAVACSLTVFAPPRDPVKICRLTIRNREGSPRRFTLFYFAELVLGANRDQAAWHVVTQIDQPSGALLARNAWDVDYAGKFAFADISLRPRSVSGDRTEFLGRHGSTAAPAACARSDLSGKVGPGLDPCAALQAAFTLGPKEERDIVVVLGETDNIDEVRRLAELCHEPGQLDAAWKANRQFWQSLTGALTIKTPDAALDLLVNHWLLPQVLGCRMWARTGFYQSSGAFGFRDQLQDSLALVYAAPAETRQQIVRAAARQFAEGDVQHWWHPPRGVGVRTRCSDDYLWLPFAVLHYVQTTGDQPLLEESVPFLKAPPLRPDQHEDFGAPQVADEAGSIYEHCLRAIKHGLRFGAHGLPLMGDGDWNDGMNRVGAQGHGESVWVGWFLLVILRRFADLCDRRGDTAHAQSFRDQAETLRGNLESHAWDGRWYRRAYFDDGTPLGSAENDECRIDSLAQSWAVLSGGADPQRARQAMEAVDEHLVKRDDRLVLLFTPPFNGGALQPGYIKGYVPGIRENGGQYTHGATWVAQAWAQLGEGDRAVEILSLLNPINHSQTPDAAARFRLEPYVLAGDVYGRPPHVGRGGWSWYTGSASWFYRVAIESILGFELRGDHFRIRPHLPTSWPSVEWTYRYGRATYHIKVQRAAAEPRRVFDGVPVENEDFPLTDDGGHHSVVVRI